MLACLQCSLVTTKKKNYEEKVHKVEDILNNWRNKRLTLIGKIAVFNVLVLSSMLPRQEPYGYFINLDGYLLITSVLKDV